MLNLPLLASAVRQVQTAAGKYVFKNKHKNHDFIGANLQKRIKFTAPLPHVIGNGLHTIWHYKRFAVSVKMILFGIEKLRK